MSLENVSISRVIKLSEFTTREKEKYYELILNNKVKFHRDESGNYVANIRMLAPGVRKEFDFKKSNPYSNSSTLSFEDRMRRLNQKYVKVRLVGVPTFDYQSYYRFSLLISSDDDVIRPKPQSLSWLMKRIEAIYDSRFNYEKKEIGRTSEILDTFPNTGPSSPTSTLNFATFDQNLVKIFPIFIVKKYCTELGLLNNIVDQACWDLLYNVNLRRRDFLEVEIFAKFLEEYYDNDDLLFYLYIRSIANKMLHVTYKANYAKSEGPTKQPKGLFISYKECLGIAKIIFGVANDKVWKSFMTKLSREMIGEKTYNSDTRRMDITQYLYLAVEDYKRNKGIVGCSASDAMYDDRMDGGIYADYKLNINNASAANLNFSLLTSSNASRSRSSSRQQEPVEDSVDDDELYSSPNGHFNYDDISSHHRPSEVVFEDNGNVQRLRAASQQATGPPKDLSSESSLIPEIDLDSGANMDQYSSSLDAYLAALSQDDPKNSLFPLNAAVQPITQTPSNQQPFSSTESKSQGPKVQVTVDIEVTDEDDEELAKTMAEYEALRATSPVPRRASVIRRNKINPPDQSNTAQAESESTADKNRKKSKQWINESGNWQESPATTTTTAADALTSVDDRTPVTRPGSISRPSTMRTSKPGEYDEGVGAGGVALRDDVDTTPYEVSGENDDVEDESEGEEEDEGEDDEFAALQLEREREYLSHLCAPLSELPHYLAEDIVGQLADLLRNKLNERLEQQHVPEDDLPHFDSILLGILQDKALQNEMTKSRDDILHVIYEELTKKVWNLHAPFIHSI